MRAARLRWVLASGLALALLGNGCGGRVRSVGPPASESPSPPSQPVTAASPSPSPSPFPTPSLSTGPNSRLSCWTGTPPPAGPGAEVVGLADVSARLSWTQQGGPGSGYMLGARIRLTRAGVTLLDTAVTAPSPLNQPDTEWAKGWEELGLGCVEIPSAGPPLVHLIGYALGMTCCSAARSYYPRPNGTYATFDRSLGRGGGTFELDAGRVDLVATNPDFNTRFDCGACSPGPLQVWTLQDGHFVDVTLQFPDRIAAEAAAWWKVIQPADPAPLGLVAPWVADECELGKQASAYATLDQLNAGGKLVQSSQPPVPDWPQGSAFVSALKSFLTTESYCH